MGLTTYPAGRVKLMELAHKGKDVYDFSTRAMIMEDHLSFHFQA